MKEAISGTWLFQIVIIFVLIFFAYLTLNINFARSFRVKNEVISIIEREEGLTEGLTSDYGSINLITHYLKQAGYSASGTCPTDVEDGYWKGLKEVDVTDGVLRFNDLFETAIPGEKYYMCVKKVSGYHPVDRQVAYYKVQLFFQFDLPFLGRLATFDITGQTTDIQYPQDDYITWTR